MKVVLSLVLLFIAVYANDEYFRKLDQIFQEPQCSSYGGICTFAVDCPKLYEYSGLCPNQQRQGVECCYGVSERETRCGKHGGECKSMGYCNPKIVYQNATDCGAKEICCILLV